MDLFKEYEGKKVLVCGASGMTGHHLFDLMEMFGAKVMGTCLTKNEYNADGKEIFVKVDFTSEEETVKLFENKFDYVFICCAQTYNAFMCEQNPTSMMLPNLQMVSNILMASALTGVKKVMYMSSATVYQPSFKILSEEDCDFNQEPAELYMGVGWVKRYIEKLCKFWHQQGLTTLVVRPTNIYGEYDKCDEKFSHVIPALINRALRKEDPYVVYGSGRCMKDFIYAKDIVVQMAKIMAVYDTPDPINLCSGELISIKDVVEIILMATQHNPKVVFKSYKPDTIPFKGLSNNKFVSLFGEPHKTPFENGIQSTAIWYSLLPQTQN